MNYSRNSSGKFFRIPGKKNRLGIQHHHTVNILELNNQKRYLRTDTFEGLPDS